MSFENLDYLRKFEVSLELLLYLNFEKNGEQHVQL